MILKFGDPLPKFPRTQKENPCLYVYGAGPRGKTCKTCSHLYLQGGTAGRYYKCAMRSNTRGPGTDHRVNWPSCGKYEEKL